MEKEKRQKPILIYTTSYCPFCARAKQLLDSKGLVYQEVDVTDNAALREEAIQKTGWQTVPIILIDGECIGGAQELEELINSGELEKKFMKKLKQ